MLGPLRTLVSVGFLVVVLWAAFSVKLGDRTFADHVDRIGETREAKALLDGARARVRPALDEVKQRMLGEYVEAPTFVPAGEAPAPRRPPAVMRVRPGALSETPAQPPAKAGPVKAGPAKAEPRAAAPRGEERALPGRRARKASADGGAGRREAP
ncbi:MAG: hypothetical protein JNL82_26985 [Myxococcales bacterium]|nr:hypothetical protein [Myxococcales bacterium]